MTSSSSVVPFCQFNTIDNPLTAVLRDGARRLLAEAMEAEAEAFLATMREVRFPDVRERLVRHGRSLGRLDVDRHQPGCGATGETTRPKCQQRGCWRCRRRVHPFHVGDPAALLSRDTPNLLPSMVARLKGKWEVGYMR